MNGDSECDLIIAAIQAAHRLDFPTCFAHLTRARQSAGQRRALAVAKDADAEAAAHASEQAVDFFLLCYQAMGTRVSRKAGEACELYKTVEQQGNSLARDPHLAPAILRLVKAQLLVTPIQISLCTAWEQVFRGNIKNARFEVDRAKDILIVALTENGIDVDRPTNDGEAPAASAPPPIETMMCLAGISYDFILTSSTIKLQDCVLTQQCDPEAEQTLWIRQVTEFFAKYAPAPSTFDLNVDLLRRLMRVCKSFAEASAALIEASRAAEQGDFRGADARAKEARRQLDNTSRGVLAANLATGPIFQETILNLKTLVVPQMEAQWRNREDDQRQISELRLELEALKRERSNVLERLSAKFGVTVNSTNELNAAITNNVDVTLNMCDRGLDELEDILRKLRQIDAPLDRDKLARADTKIQEARETKNVEQKIKKVRSVVDDMKGIVESAAKIAPHLIAAFTAVASLFGL